MKFGGTSVQNAEAMLQSATVVQERIAKKPIVVLSACSGITNKLVQLSTAIVSNHKYADSIILEILSHHRDVVASVKLDIQTQNQLHTAVEELLTEFTTFLNGITLLKECTPRSADTLLSFGELLSSTIFTYLLKGKGINACLVFAKECVVTSRNFGNAIVDYEATKNSTKIVVEPLLKDYDCIITQGFIGSFEGITTTLGRGGSDFSAAIFGYALEVEEIQIWTDVSGVFTTDPRMVSDATTINQLTFEEIRDLSVYGAKVLHPETILPAVKSSIPVKVLNTFKPNDSGTEIHTTPLKKVGKPKAVSALQKCTTITIWVPIEQESSELLNEILPKLIEDGISMLLLTVTESKISFTTKSTLDEIHPLLHSLKYTFENTSLICVLVEQSLHTRTAILELLKGFLIEQYSISNSENSFLIVCKEPDTVAVVTAIHKSII